MVHSDVQYCATAHQALQSLQVPAPSNKAGVKGSAIYAILMNIGQDSDVATT